MIPPVSKRLACGDLGQGAMAAPEDIAAACQRALGAAAEGVGAGAGEGGGMEAGARGESGV